MIERPLGPRVVETHISTLFFVADRVYKLSKRIDLPFLHTVDAEDRLALAQRELELNRRFAPDVYLGVADVTEGDELVDRMIVMRRLPEDRRLSTLIDGSGAAKHLHSVARTIAAFHANAAPIFDTSVATAEHIARNWADNFTALRSHVGTIIDPGDFAAVKTMAETQIRQRHDLFERRLTDGFVRDGHGDLIADDIYCLSDGPRILDCLAFDDDLRIGDVLNDIAFLVMDVHRLAGPEPARSLMRSYHEFSNEQHPSSLAHFYVAYRAHVRAKVACLRVEQGDRESVDLARRYHSIARHHLERAQIRAIIVGGGPGVGKTLLSRRLADHLGYVHLATDDIRHDVTHTPHDRHAFAAPHEGIYTPAMIDATYREQRREAALLTVAGHGVVLDASWSSEDHRAALRELMAERGVDVVEIECVLDGDLARERIAWRLANPDDPSDATPALVDRLGSLRDTWPSAQRISTAPPIDEVVTMALSAIGTNF